MPRKREDLTGREFGRLTVIGYDRTSSNGDTYKSWRYARFRVIFFKLC